MKCSRTLSVVSGALSAGNSSRALPIASSVSIPCHQSFSTSSRSQRDAEVPKPVRRHGAFTPTLLKHGRRAQSPICDLTLQKVSLRHASTSAAESTTLRKTALYDLHVAHGGKMVPFAGYHMPVQYGTYSITASHAFTRTASSLFDVSHMVQHTFSGPGVNAFLNTITPMSISSLPVHHNGLSTLLWPMTGGIVDDTIITRLGPEAFYVVTNAGCREKDLKYFEEQLEDFKQNGGGEVKWEVMEGQGQVALQGPRSEEVLGGILADLEAVKLNELYFGQSKYVKVLLKGTELSSPLLVSRGGYTGEDGFEISIPAEETTAVTEALLARGGEDKCRLAGLGARDSLRLEAGMCLYGHDLNDTITPVEGSLAWVIGKDRRTEGGFNGAENILRQLRKKADGGGVEKRRVGLIVEGAPAREGAEIVTADGGEKVGVVTSGCPSPTLGKNIAMGYVKDGLHKSGTELQVLVRGKPRKAMVTKMPFVPSKFWKGAAPA